MNYFHWRLMLEQTTLGIWVIVLTLLALWMALAAIWQWAKGLHLGEEHWRGRDMVCWRCGKEVASLQAHRMFHPECR